jgi:SPP1 gp7 family putative phage head morphogenesis protein
MATNEELIALEATHTLYIQRIAAKLGNDAKPYIAEMKKEITDRVNMEVGKSLTANRRKKLLSDINDITRRHLAEYTTELAKEDAVIGKYEADWQSKQIGAMYPDAEAVVITKAAVNTAAKTSLIKLGEGTYTSYNQMLTNYTSKNAQQISAIVANGFVGGVSTRAIANQVLTETDNRIIKTQKEAMSIARTGTNHYANTARRVYFEEEPLVEYMQHISVLDSRTSRLCSSRDGAIFKKSERQYYPPLHYNCRSSASPYIPAEDGEQEAGNRPSNFRDADSGLLQPTQTNSKNIFYDEFAKLDAATQDEQLGPSLGKAFRKGIKNKTITPESFAKMTIDEKNLTPLTLKELEAKDNALGKILRAQN